MQIQQRINAIAQLGEVLSEVNSENKNPEISELYQLAQAQNGWFTKENIDFSFKNWSEALTQQNIEQWLSTYELTALTDEKTVAIIMAGNIPLVGLHDFISVLLSGHKVKAKLSSNDKLLLPFLAKRLCKIEPEFEGYISFTEERLTGFDAVIATGSNNTARYFDHYFGKYPNIIRRNRNSVAILDGTESEAQLTQLANDIFRYYGLGCRNVSKVYLPNDYNFDPFFQAMFSWKQVINEHKYINNYDYNKAVYLMSLLHILDNEFLLLKEDQGFSSPISVVFYEYYENTADLKTKLLASEDQIQCVVSQTGIPNEISFGQAQTPELWDYADGVDTISILQKL